MEYKNILFEVKNRIAFVTINRPDKLNALSNAIIEELNECFLSIKNDNKINVAIITGSGVKAFVAVADIMEINKLDAKTGKIFAEKGQNVFNLIEKMEKPVIAAVNGFALGGGCELAMMCDFIIAADNAKFGQPEITLGVMPGMGGSQRLTRYVGKSKAMDMCLTGRMMDAAEAERSGLRGDPAGRGQRL